jgi:hypothetical protein
MPGKIVFFLLGLVMTGVVAAQNPVRILPAREPQIDTSFTDYDLLFNELDALLDSLTAPRNFFVADIAWSNGYYNYVSKNSYLLQAQKKYVFHAFSILLFKNRVGYWRHYSTHK